jgi:glycerol dehydrogenase
MNRIAAFPGKYIQGQGALKTLPDLIRSIGTKGLMLVSKSGKNQILPKFSNPSITEFVDIELFGGECTEEELERLGNIIQKTKLDLVIGMGGGKTIDTAKIAADRANIPVIIIPTIASTDAPCSGCAVTYTKAGVFEKVHYQRTNPSVVLVEMDIIASAPPRFLVAGMGDALATWFEASACSKTSSTNECGGISTLAGLNLAKLCYDVLLEHGLQAKLDNEQGKVTSSLHAITEANILLSGIGFESGGLAAAHAIHNGLTVLEETHEYYHGEKVAFGVLAGLHLNSVNFKDIEQVYSFCETIGLPTTLAGIGIVNSDIRKLTQVALKATEDSSSIHHEACEVSPGKVIDAIIEADKMGNTRKQTK